MSGSVEYPYDQGDLLSQPHNYFYSPFGGASFLGAWKEARAHYARMAPEPPRADAPVRRLPAGSAEIDTAFLLDTFVVALCMGHFSAAQQQEFDALLRNFEAKRRLYSAYWAGFSSRGRDDCRDVALYVRFGEVLALAYTRSCGLPCLNALHKCLDILGATYHQIPIDMQTRMAWLIHQERSFIEQLARTLGVSLP